MSTIRVVWGSATGPTAMAAYDAALADANVHEYNLVQVSSVVPAGADLEVVGSAPDLGPAGDRLTVVQARCTRSPGSGAATAALGWARSDDGAGIFYEASGDPPEELRRSLAVGLDHGVSLRDWTEAEREILVREADGDPRDHVTTVLLAVYGESVPLS